MRGGWQADIRVQLPGGMQVRERRVFRTASKSAVQRCSGGAKIEGDICSLTARPNP